MTWRKRTAEEREWLRHPGMSIRTEDEMERAIYSETLQDQYGDQDPSVDFAHWTPQMFVRAAHPGRDGNAVASYDDRPWADPHVFPRTYPAWKAGETFVVSGPLGDWNARHPPPPDRIKPVKRKGQGRRNNERDPDPSSGTARGRFFRTRREARAWAMDKYGAVMEEYATKGKWAMRVPVPGGPHDPRVKR